MFVFPAFNESYNKRKRTYKCCRKCRSRRVKCILSSTDFDITGCENCAKTGLSCDLIKDPKPAHPTSNGTGATDANGANGDANGASDANGVNGANSGTNGAGASTNEAAAAAAHTDTVKTEKHSPVTKSYPWHNRPFDPHAPPIQPQFSQFPPLYSGQTSTGQFPLQAQIPPPQTQPQAHMPQPQNVNPQGPSSLLQPPVSAPVFPLLQPYYTNGYMPPQHPVPPCPSDGSYGPSPNFTGPSPNFTGPSPNYPGPSPNFTGPSPGFTGPSPAFIAPSPSYSGPSPAGSGPSPNPGPGIYLVGKRPASRPSSPDRSKRPNLQFSTPPTSGQTMGSSPETVRHISKLTPISLSDPPQSSIIDAAYLRQKYGFVISITLNLFSEIPAKGESTDSYEIPIGAVPTGHIRDIETYESLRYLNAFTLSDPKFPITPQQEVQLLQIYFSRINSVFPIVKEDLFWKNYNQRRCSSVLVFAMVLVTLRDATAEPIISAIIGSDRFLEKLDGVISRLDRKIRQIIYVLPELGDDDRLTQVLVYALLCLSFRPFKFGNEQSSQDLFSAIGLANTLLIHMESNHKKLIKSGKEEFLKYYRSLWYTLYVLDVFNGIICLKIFLIKKEDFDLQKPEDHEVLTPLINCCERLQEVVFLIYQPMSSFSIERLNSIESETQVELEKLRHVDVSPLNYSRAQIHIFKVCLFGLQQAIIQNINLRRTDRMYEFSDVYMSICSYILELVNHLGESSQQDLILQVPVMPSVFSVFLSIMLKYKVKIIYLTELKRLDGRSDLNEQKINLVSQFLMGYYDFFKQCFDKWWFVNEILDNIKKLVFAVQHYDKDLTSVQDQQDQEQLIKHLREHELKRKEKNNKLNINLIISNNELALPPILSIGSTTFVGAATMVQSNVLRRTAMKNLGGAESKSMYQSNSQDMDKPITPIKGDDLNDTKPGDDIVTSTDVFNEMEGRRFLQFLNDEIFTSSRFSEFVTEDPSLRDFFLNLE